MLDKFFGSPNPSNVTITVTGIDLANATTASVGGTDQSVLFTPTGSTSGTFALTSFVNISSLTGAPYTYK